MKPPRCTICGKNALNDNAGLIYFKRTEKDKAWYIRAQEPGFCGHPPNSAWFCDNHFKAANIHKKNNLSLGEAIKAIKQK